jgi:hypothetical protein
LKSARRIWLCWMIWTREVLVPLWRLLKTNRSLQPWMRDRVALER